MRIIKELALLDNASSGTESNAITNVNCDLISLSVEGDGSFKILVEGCIKKNSDFIPMAIIPLDTYRSIDAVNGITANGLYETGIAGVYAVKLVVSSGSGVNVYARFINTSI